MNNSKNTTYNGIVYRSKLESFWAKLFDKLEVKFKYEPKLFKLSNDRSYLPDFYLPETENWIEIKGKSPTIDELKKAQLLSEEYNLNISVASGKPEVMRFRSNINDDIVLEVCNFSLDSFGNNRFQIASKNSLGEKLGLIMGVEYAYGVTFFICSAILYLKHQPEFHKLSDILQSFIVDLKEKNGGYMRERHFEA